MTGGRTSAAAGALRVILEARVPSGDYQMWLCRGGVGVMAGVTRITPSAHVIGMTFPPARWVESAIAFDRAARVVVGISVVPVTVKANFIGSHRSRCTARDVVIRQ